jgi:AcrR family transcriptional regulator
MRVTRGPQRRLSERQFIEAALDLADREGLAALNVRRLAATLDMSPNSLYTYFENKQALLDKMFGRAMANLPLEDVAGGEARAEILAAYRALFAAMSEHPCSVELLMEGVGSPQADAARERFHRVLARAGMTAPQRVRAISLLTGLVLGNVIVDTFRGTRSRPRELERRRALDAELFPRLTEASAPENQGSLTDAFDLSLEALVDRLFAEIGS